MDYTEELSHALTQFQRRKLRINRDDSEVFRLAIQLVMLFVLVGKFSHFQFDCSFSQNLHSLFWLRNSESRNTFL